MTTMPQTEAQFQRAVTDLAATLRWRRAHFRTAQTKNGNHVTPVAYEGKGFPDLVLVRDRVIFAEIKGSKGRLRPEQREWLADLSAAGGEAYCWGPKDWDEVVATLTRVDGVGG